MEPTAKRVVKLAISAGLHALDRSRRLLGWSLAQQHRGVILLYHEVQPDQAPRLAAQVAEFQRHHQVVPLGQLQGPPDGSWRVAITFDDALASFGQQAVPTLSALGAPVTLFVPSDLLGTDGYMSSAQLKDLPGSVEIGSHSRRHRRLSDLSEPELHDEVDGSRHLLEQLVGSTIERFAFPFGDWNDAVAESARAAGYGCAYSVRPACAGGSDFVQPRVTLEPDDWRLEHRLKAAGAYRWMGTFMSLRRRWFSHPV